MGVEFKAAPFVVEQRLVKEILLPRPMIVINPAELKKQLKGVAAWQLSIFKI